MLRLHCLPGHMFLTAETCFQQLHIHLLTGTFHLFILYLLSCNFKAKLHAHFFSMLIDQGPLGLPGRPGDPGEKGDTGELGLSVSSLASHIKMSLYP